MKGSEKKRFCKRCGGEIIEGACSQCGHKYFGGGRKWPKAAKGTIIGLSVLLALVSGLSIWGLCSVSNLQRAVASKDERIAKLEFDYEGIKNANKKMTAESLYFRQIKDEVFFVNGNNEAIYHYYTCELLKKDGISHAYTGPDAKALGYTGCDVCHAPNIFLRFK